jgi:hypothetical protein
VVLHYLNGGVEIEVFFGHAVFPDGAALQRAEQAVAGRLQNHQVIRAVRLNCCVAPN